MHMKCAIKYPRLSVPMHEKRPFKLNISRYLSPIICVIKIYIYLSVMTIKNSRDMLIIYPDDTWVKFLIEQIYRDL